MAVVSPTRFVGRPGAPGRGVGPLVHLALTDLSAPSSARSIDRVADVDAEQRRLTDALGTARAQLQELAQRTSHDIDSEIGAIFEAQALFADDPGLVGPSLEVVSREGLSAAAAFQQVSDRAAAQLAAIDDPYLRERAADIRDVCRRVTAILEGRDSAVRIDSSRPCIVTADDLDASVVATFRPQLVTGICLRAGAATGHAAIVARAIGIPVVLAIGASLDEVPEGTTVAVDGDEGIVVVEPGPADAERFARAAAPAPQGAHHRSPAVGHDVRLEANVGSEREAASARAAGADGIGLVRTELLFLGRRDMPDVAEQAAVYRRIRAQMDGRPVVFRTLDIGGDKPGPLASATPEANPALGVRGIRFGLAHREVLANQLQALLVAAAGERLDVMFPMVATVEELRAARSVLREAMAEATRAGRSLPEDVNVGIMIEVPAAALTVDAFLADVDFLSIGTNDLAQYVMAADRTHPELARLGTPLQPALLRLVSIVVEAARSRSVPVAVCGEAAAHRLAAPLLVGLGVDVLSVTPPLLAGLRERLSAVPLAACRKAAVAALQASSLSEVERVAEGMG